MQNDRITQDADWHDGINAFRKNAIERLDRLEAQNEMLMERITWLESPPKAPHIKIKQEDKL